MICSARRRIREEEQRSLSHFHLSFSLTLMLDMMNDDNQLKLFFMVAIMISLMSDVSGSVFKNGPKLRRVSVVTPPY